MLSRFSYVRLFATLRTVARQAPLSMGYPRQGYWSGLPCPFPGNLPDPGIEPVSPESPALMVDSLLLSPWGSPSKGLQTKLSLQGQPNNCILIYEKGKGTAILFLRG